MHELALADDLIRTVKHQLDRDGITERVLSLRLLIGPFSCVNPDSLRFSFSLLSSGTAMSGAALEFEKLPLLLTCRGCDKTSECADFLERCPHCGAGDVYFDGERAVRLDTIEVED